MKKIYSLIKACMSSDMHIFKIYSKKKNRMATLLFPLFIGLYLMFAIYMMADGLFEKYLQCIFNILYYPYLYLEYLL